MTREKKLNLLGLLIILSATVLWGSSFPILKDVIVDGPKFFVIGIRFLSAGLILCVIFIKRILKTSKEVLIQSLILGSVVAGAYFAQTWGLAYTTPGRNAFLTATYCIICPFLLWIFYKRAPKSYNIISAVSCLIGIGLIALSGNEQVGSNTLLGDGLTLIGAIFYSFQIIFIARFQEKKTDNIQLLTLQFIVVGVILLLATVVLDLPVYPIEKFKLNGEQWGKVIYLMLACTLYAQGAQLFGMKLVSSANQAAIVLSLEAVFGVIFSIILGQEQLTPALIIGFVLIFISIIVSETKVDFKKLLKIKNKDFSTTEKVENSYDKSENKG